MSLHAPKLKLQDDPSPDALTVRDTNDRAADPVMPKRSWKPKATKTMGTAGRAHAERESFPGPELAPDPGNEPAAKASLPAARGSRRVRVNEISLPAADAVPARAPKPEPSVENRVEKDPAKEPSGRRRRFSRGERNEWGEQAAGGSLRWLINTGLAVIALVVVAVIFNRNPSGSEDRAEQSMYSQLTPEEVAAEAGAGEDEMMENLARDQETAGAIFAAYATAKSPDDFMGMVHRSADLAGLIAGKWKPLEVPSGWKPDGKATWSVTEQDDGRFGTLTGVFPNFDPYRAFFRFGEGEMKLDWKATTGYGSADFGTLKTGGGDGSEIRTFISLANFHTFPLPEGEFRAFRLVSPDGQDYVWGYAKAGGAVDAELGALFAPSQITGEAQTEVAVVVRLERGPEQSLGSQWMITKLIRPDWLDEP